MSALFTLVASVLLAADGPTGGTTEDPTGVRNLNLEQLLATPVTTVKRKEDSLTHSAGAVYVITQQELRRFGVTSIPEALRLVPGMDVARVGLTSWAVSARGYNAAFANKLLVMIDGRTVYTPVFGAVHWDSQDALIDDIDRIEVMRGPGAVMWGANAVNGVVNIITKTSQRTQGTQVTVGSGTQDQALTRFRHGGAAGRRGFYRVYAQHTLRTGDQSDGTDMGTARWSFLQGGFRGDWTPTGTDTITVQGDSYRSGFRIANQTPMLTPPYSQLRLDRGVAAGANALARWEHTHGDGASTTVQSYFDVYGRDSDLLSYVVQTVDFDVQHRRHLFDRHELVVGVGGRGVWDQTTLTEGISFADPRRQYGLFHATLQDEWTLKPNRLAITGGVRLERNSFTGWSLQPTARLLYTPTRKHTFWGAISHAVRTPSRGELGFQADVSATAGPGLPILARTTGTPDLRNELGNTVEGGVRWQWNQRLIVDSTVYYSWTDGAAQLVIGTPSLRRSPLGDYLLAPAYYVNGLKVDTAGWETAVRFEATREWHLAGAYTLFDLHYHSEFRPAGLQPDPLALSHNSPPHQFSIRSEWNPRRRWELDAAYFWNAGLMPANPATARRQRLDARLGWLISESAELSVGVQNLLNPHRIEIFNHVGPASVVFGRQAYVRLGFRF